MEYEQLPRQTQEAILNDLDVENLEREFEECSEELEIASHFIDVGGEA